MLGAYRQTGINRIWVAHSRAEANAYDALNTAVHRDTGLVLPTGAEGAAVLAEKLRKRVEEYEFTYAGMKLPLTMTFGVAQYSDDYGVDACIVGADSALYKGKNIGRNCVVTF